jgi:hypothetical protein
MPTSLTRSFGVVIDQSARHGLHHADLHQMFGHGVSRLNAPVRDTHSPQCLADLFNDLLAVRQDDDTVAFRLGAPSDLGEDYRLATTGRQNEQHPEVPLCKRLLDLLDAGDLVVAEFERHRLRVHFGRGHAQLEVA